MRGLVFGAALTVLAMAAAVEAQTPAAPAAPATQKPAPAQPAPTQPAPAPATPPPAPRPFPEGAKIAYVVLQRIANESAEGKTASTKIQALQTKKAAELNEKNKQLQGLQAKLEKEGSVMSLTAQGDLQKQVERLQVDIQRFTQDAQAEIQELQNQLQQAFQVRIEPVLAQVGQEKGLHLIFNGPDSGLVWADPGLDISNDVIKKLDAIAAGAKPPVK
jgi:Skp family chaperone for outer membrane proteins